MSDLEKHPKNFKEKAKTKFKEFSGSQTAQKLKDFTVENKGEASAFVLLLLGFIITFSNPLFGTSILGILTGFFFWEEIVSFFSHIKAYIIRNSFIKLAIIAFIFLIFFLAYPLFIITVALVVSIMQAISLLSKKK